MAFMREPHTVWILTGAFVKGGSGREETGRGLSVHTVIEPLSNSLSQHTMDTETAQ